MISKILSLLFLFSFVWIPTNAKAFSIDAIAIPDSLSIQVESDSLKIISLEKELEKTSSDAEKFRLSKSLAEQLYFFSFRQFENESLRKNELERSLKYSAIAEKYQRPETFRGMICAVRFEVGFYYETKEMISNVNWCKAELDSIFKTDLTNPMASLVYGALCYEISQTSGYKKFMARMLYEPLPEDVNLDKAVLNLLHAKRSRSFPVFVNYRLAQVYLALGNHKFAELSMQDALAEPEVYPYFDTHFKKQTEKLLTAYRSRNK